MGVQRAAAHEVTRDVARDSERDQGIDRRAVDAREELGLHAALEQGDPGLLLAVRGDVPTPKPNSGNNLGEMIWGCLGPYLFVSLYVDDGSEVSYPGYARVVVPRTDEYWEIDSEGKDWKTWNRKGIVFPEIIFPVEQEFQISAFGVCKESDPKDEALFWTYLDHSHRVRVGTKDLTFRFEPGELSVDVGANG